MKFALAEQIQHTRYRARWTDGEELKPIEDIPSLEPNVQFLECWRQIFLGGRPRGSIWFLREIGVAVHCSDFTDKPNTSLFHQPSYNKPMKTKS